MIMQRENSSTSWSMDQSIQKQGFAIRSSDYASCQVENNCYFFFLFLEETQDLDSILRCPGCLAKHGVGLSNELLAQHKLVQGAEAIAQKRNEIGEPTGVKYLGRRQIGVCGSSSGGCGGPSPADLGEPREEPALRLDHSHRRRLATADEPPRRDSKRRHR